MEKFELYRPITSTLMKNYSYNTADRLERRELIMMGDFNKSLQKLQLWAATADLSSLGEELLH